MKKLISLLIIGLFLFSCQDSIEFVDTVNREELAVILLNSTGAIDAYWESPEVLVLTFKRDSINKMLNTSKEIKGEDITLEQKTKEMAIVYAILGRNTTDMKTCVKIYYTDGQELAYECAGKKSEP